MADQDSMLGQEFKRSFAATPQQRTSLFERTLAVEREEFSTKLYNKAKTGTDEVYASPARNQETQWKDFLVSNRKYSTARFVLPIRMDRKDVSEAIANPNGPAMAVINAAFARNKDRVINAAALASIAIGASDAVASMVTAANDGVIAVDASSGLTYDIMRSLWKNFINNSVEIDPMFGNGMTFFGTGKENYQLMGEDKFINNDYTMYRPVDAGRKMEQAGGMGIVTFPGNELGSSIDVASPILTEGTTLRSCLAMANGAISFCEKIASVRFYDDLEAFDDSSGIKVVCYIGAARNDGKLIQEAQTTI